MYLALKNYFNDFVPISDKGIDSRDVLNDIYDRVLSCYEIMWANRMARESRNAQRFGYR